jgi:hypothetical protein
MTEAARRRWLYLVDAAGNPGVRVGAHVETAPAGDPATHVLTITWPAALYRGKLPAYGAVFEDAETGERFEVLRAHDPWAVPPARPGVPAEPPHRNAGKFAVLGCRVRAPVGD